MQHRHSCARVYKNKLYKSRRKTRENCCGCLARGPGLLCRSISCYINGKKYLEGFCCQEAPRQLLHDFDEGLARDDNTMVLPKLKAARREDGSIWVLGNSAVGRVGRLN